MTTKLLAIDTSTEACSAALLVGDDVGERYQVAPRAHARLILSMVDELMTEAGLRPQQLDAVAFGRGPGAFTGVRIAAGVVQGIAFGADLPVVPVSSLAALAQEAMDDDGEDQVLAAIEARMGEVYWGAYRRDGEGYARRLGEEEVASAADVVVPDAGDWAGAGSGWGAYGEALTRRLDGRVTRCLPERFPRARAVARLGARGWRCGEGVAPHEALPVYLRNKVVHTP